MSPRVPLPLYVLLLCGSAVVDGVRTGWMGRRGEGVSLSGTTRVLPRSNNDEEPEDSSALLEVARGLGGLVTDDANFTSWPKMRGIVDDGEGANWMSVDAAVVYPRTLSQLTLPGTHDSGAYRLTHQLMPDPRFPTPWVAAAVALAERLHIPIDHVITPWALTQSMDVGEQLRAGYRYIDLRAGWNGSHWCAHHAEVGTLMRTIFRQVAKFMTEQPGEMMVVQVSHLDGFPTDEQIESLAKMVGEELRGMLVPLPSRVDGSGSGSGPGLAVNLNRTVGEMVKSGERVLVTFGDGDYYARRASSSSSSSSLPYPYSHLWPPWTLHNTYANTDDPDAMVHHNREQVAAFCFESSEGVPGSLFKLSWTLTTQTRTVLESVLPSHPKSLRDLNDLGAPLLAPFVRDIIAMGCRAGNILSVDFALTSDAVKVARVMNAKIPSSLSNTVAHGRNTAVHIDSSS